MKTIISIHIPPGSEVLVKIGELVSGDSPIAAVAGAASSFGIDLAKILKVHPQKISQYLKKKIGDKLVKGDIIAEKKNLFSSVAVKSPTDGNIESIDLKIGSLSLVSDLKEKKHIYSSIKGKVISIKEKVVEVECEAEAIDAEKGSGGKAHGRLYHLKGESIGVLDVPSGIEKTIILVHHITDAAVAKIDALGVEGIIMGKEEEDVKLPYVWVGKSSFSKLEENVGREIVIDPANKKIFILA